MNPLLLLSFLLFLPQYQSTAEPSLLSKIQNSIYQPLKKEFLWNFSLEEISTIEIKEKSSDFSFLIKKEEEEWEIQSKKKQLANRKLIEKLILFSQNLYKEESFPKSEEFQNETGLSTGLEIKLLNQKGETLSHYILGNSSPWRSFSQGQKDPIPSSYILSLKNKFAKKILLCSNQIANPLENLSLEKIRDHFPLPPSFTDIQKMILLNDKEYEIKILKEKNTWEIQKPLKVRADKKIIKNFLLTLSQLEADEIQIENKSASVNLEHPNWTIELENENKQIQKFFFFEEAQKIYCFNPENSFLYLYETKEKLQVIRNSLKFKNLNQFREQSLVKIEESQLQKIEIRTEKTLLILRKEKEWILQIGEKTLPVSKKMLSSLLQLLQGENIKNFVSDSSKEIANYKLNSPKLTISLYSSLSETPKKIFFQQEEDTGKVYSYVEDKLGIFEIFSKSFNQIRTEPYHWKTLSPWEIHEKEIQKIEIYSPASVLLIPEKKGIWKILKTESQTEIYPNQIHIKRLIKALQNFQVKKWIAPNKQAMEALQNPRFSLQIRIQKPKARKEFYYLSLAPINSQEQFFYGYLNNSLFLIDQKSYKTLTSTLKFLLQK